MGRQWIMLSKSCSNLSHGQVILCSSLFLVIPKCYYEKYARPAAGAIIAKGFGV